MPFGQSIFIPTLHPRRASPASPVGRGRGPAAAAVAFASLPCVPVPLALLAPPPLRSLTLVGGGIPPVLAGRSHPRLTLACASGIPPALQKVSIVVLSRVLLLFPVRNFFLVFQTVIQPSPQVIPQFSIFHSPFFICQHSAANTSCSFVVPINSK